ncbi:MAG TPA: hypothetical protein VL588_11930 [Bdellovibrionota bacterium]|nr:hypothetical protein [Bdellovibrionota bacterium]
MGGLLAAGWFLATPAPAAPATLPCRTFRVHHGADPPATWPGPGKIAPASEAVLLEKFAGVPGYSGFASEYRRWRNENPDAWTQAERAAWLECVLFYAHQDTDHDGVPDWGAWVDGRPSRVLYPLDDDADGDGISNILDSDPYKKSVGAAPVPGVVPLHLRDPRPEVAALQARLYSTYGILAVNHTDDHSPELLADLLELLDGVFSAALIRSLTEFKILYAFAGHDSQSDIAAFHVEAHAISVGGMQAYPVEAPPRRGARHVAILSALAHEMGHAFVFSRLTPADLSDLGARYGGWGPVALGPTDTFLSPVFLTRRPAGGAPPPSTYALSNLHEWFAEAFAAAALRALGVERGPERVPAGFSRWFRSAAAPVDRS